MKEDVPRRMTEDELRRALADMRAMAQAEKDFPLTTVRSVDVSAEDVDAIREAHRLLAGVCALWADLGYAGLGEFGSPENAPAPASASAVRDRRALADAHGR